MNNFDVIVMGGGPAGMAAALAAEKEGARTALIEREEKIGGILRQCIHDGFGLIRFNQRLTGPEYAWKFTEEVRRSTITLYPSTFVKEIHPEKKGYRLVLISPDRGDFSLFGKSLVMATGCRERTDRQIFIHGDRPSGIFTAGQAQNLINLRGFRLCKRCVILGSGDIGLIMARRLTLEGCEVVGVYEMQARPGGLRRNIAQCLEDYSLPLHLERTVTRVHGKRRVEAVTIAKVDHDRKPIHGTEERIPCDALILSVGLIPENDLLESLEIPLDRRTRGPEIDQNRQTRREGLFACGNAVHVNDLVDYVSESGEKAGKAAASHATGARRRKALPVEASGEILYQVPAFLDPANRTPALVFLRTRIEMEKALLVIHAGDQELLRQNLRYLSPPEMIRIILPLDRLPDQAEKVEIRLTEVKS